MSARHLFLALYTAFVFSALSFASSPSQTTDDEDIGVITRPSTAIPPCIEPAQAEPRQDNDDDIGIITRPATEAPACIEPAPPSQEPRDAAPDPMPLEHVHDPAASPCPADMVAIGDRSCLDRFEASRPDATAVSMGTDTSMATSRAGVLPWFPVAITTARAACAAAGKRVCKESEIRSACQGPTATTYTYGNAYAPATCNGIDTFCHCDSQSCADVQPCPYPGCYNRGPDGVVGKGCGAALRVMPTGAFPGCVNEYGAYDLSGNVWEPVDRGTGESWYMGDAFNCLDSEALHRCDSLVQDVSARGFRCCTDQPLVR